MIMAIYVTNNNSEEVNNKQDSLLIKSIQEKYGNVDELKFGEVKNEDKKEEDKPSVEENKEDKKQLEETAGKIRFRFNEENTDNKESTEDNQKTEDNKKEENNKVEETKKEIKINEELLRPISPPKKSE